MARDLLRRPPLRVSEMPPHEVSMYPGEPKMIVCPGCHRWLRPSNGGLRRHPVDADIPARTCPETGRRVWFDLDSAEWLLRMELGTRDAALRRSAPVQRKAALEVPPPVFRLAGAR